MSVIRASICLVLAALFFAGPEALAQRGQTLWTDEQQAVPGGFGRVLSMGMTGGRYGFYEDDHPPMMFLDMDPSFMLINPAYQSGYANYLWGNVSSNNGYRDQYFGGHFRVSKEWTLGALLSYDTKASRNIELLKSDAEQQYYFDQLTPPVTFTRPDYTGIPVTTNAVTLLASNRSKNDVVGFSITYMNAHNSTETQPPSGDPTTFNSSAYQLLLRLGFIVATGKFSKLDGFVRYGHSAATVDYIVPASGRPTTEFEHTASLDVLGLGGRYISKINDNVSLLIIAEGSYAWNGFSFDRIDAGFIVDSLVPLKSTLHVQGGIGMQYNTDRTLVTGGIIVLYTTNTYDFRPDVNIENTDTYTYWALPRFTIGCEHRITDWLTGRVGYFRDLLYRSRTVRRDGTETNTSSNSGETNRWISIFPDELVTVGAGINIDRFAIDWAMSGEVLRKIFKLDLTDKPTEQIYITVSYNIN